MTKVVTTQKLQKKYPDRRVEKTHKLLKDALITLILEKGFEAVTIQEILDRANVGRSTFYIHFQNKHELLHSCFEEFFDLFNKHNPDSSNSERSSIDLNECDLILNLLRLVEQNKLLFKALLRKDGMTILHPIYNYIFTYIDKAIKKLILNKKQTPLQLEMGAHYITGALIGTLTWWVSKDMDCNVEEMYKYLKESIMHDMKNIVGSEGIYLSR